MGLLPRVLLCLTLTLAALLRIQLPSLVQAGEVAVMAE